MKNNYKIVYGLMKIQDKNMDFYYYIVSKCFLVGEVKKYNRDGSFEIIYNVSFPYNLNNLKYEEPKEICDNDYHSVDKIFNNYDEALKYRNEKNKHILAYLSDEEKTKWHNDFHFYQALEETILNNLKNLKNVSKKILHPIITNDGKLDYDLYTFIKYNHQKYIVYSISEQQYDILSKLNDKKYINKLLSGLVSLTKPILYSDGVLIKVISECDGCYYFKSDNYFRYNKNMSKLDISKINTNNILKIFTTETVEDIINSYKNYDNITLSEIVSKVYKNNNH